MNNNDKLAAAYVRGCLIKDNTDDPKSDFLSVSLDCLTEDQIRDAIAYGKSNGMKMYYFKEKEDLPRVRAALGFLKAILPESLLDVGSGRGAFLFPFMRDFPYTEVTSLDILPHRVEFLRTIHDGGIERLNAVQADICTWKAPNSSFDAVTLLEVLEHIPEVEQAVKNAVRLAKRCIVVSIPSKPDNNPEHIHLLTKDRLTKMFKAAGVEKLHFDGVNGHLVLIAIKG